MLGVGETAVSIGTDDAEIMERLAPWRIDADYELVDYGIELHPPTPEARGAPRPMGRVCHGSHDLARSQDPRSLTRVFLRLLGAHEQPARPGELRLTMPAVARAHAALLAPLAVNLGLIPDRWYAARDLTPFVALTTRVDIDTMEVVVDPPLGSGEDPVRVRLAGCWLASYNSSRELTPGRAVAYLMGSVCDVTPANAPVALRQVADLVAHVPPVESPWLMRDVMAGLEIELSERGGA